MLQNLEINFVAITTQRILTYTRAKVYVKVVEEEEEEEEEI
jgi:hypothetical protein